MYSTLADWSRDQSQLCKAPAGKWLQCPNCGSCSASRGAVRRRPVLCELQLVSEGGLSEDGRDGLAAAGEDVRGGREGVWRD